MSGESVKVIVRCRPVNERETRLNCEVAVNMDQTLLQIQLQKPGSDQQAPHKQFTFDGVYNMNDTTQSIYEDICFPLVTNVLEGYNGTVFAYGQTGCGKSFTMVGIEEPKEQLGIIPRAFDHIFDYISVTKDTKFIVQASYLEIYNEEVRDLLGKDVKRKLDCKEHPEKGVYVSGLTQHKVCSRPELENIMATGSKNRSMGATLMNVDSSRSHCIFSIDVEMLQTIDGEEKVRSGKLNLVDLAGSERQSKTGATGERLKEATKINLSLSALGNVISALVDGKAKHIPYRDSKLTRLLQSSLGGNTKTLMVACVSPADNNYDETLSTLRYANRAKNIKNKPKINEDPKDALLREYQEEIKKLKLMLSGQMPGTTVSQIAGSSTMLHSPAIADQDQLDQLRAEYEEKLSSLREQYGAEQANRTRLEQDMMKLQSDYETQVAEAKALSGDLDKHGLPGQQPGSDGPNGLPLNDKQILESHEAALQKLANLQEGMIGGERADDSSLKLQLEQRKQHAEDRLVIVHEKSGPLDDEDGILERIFSNITEEVRAKTRALEKMQQKCKMSEEEVKDIQGEFEEERQDLLDMIRKQQRTLQLQNQLLDTIVPLLRRDCNYYNLDRIMTECKYNEDKGNWTIPKVATSSTNLSSISSYNSPTHTAPPQGGKHPKRGSNPSNGRSLSPNGLHPSTEDDNFAAKWQSKGNNVGGYFSPKRAHELLSECSTIKGTPPTDRPGNKMIKPTGSDHAHTPSGFEPQYYLNEGMGANKPPRKLDAIPNLPAVHYQAGTAPHSSLLPSVEPSVLEKADKIIQMKRNSKPKQQLGSLSDHGRKQF